MFGRPRRGRDLRLVGTTAGLLIAILTAAACGGSNNTTIDGATGGGQRFPDIVSVEVSRTEQRYSFSVTMSSPYDTPGRYADGWRIVGFDGTVYGEHTITQRSSLLPAPSETLRSPIASLLSSSKDVISRMAMEVAPSPSRFPRALAVSPVNPHPRAGENEPATCECPATLSP